MFSRELIQAISDFQRDAKNSEQKATRGQRLKEAARALPQEYRTSALICYRQVSLKKNSVWVLADTLALPEAISSWTVDLGVAQNFKGGVPPAGEYQGMIFGIMPSEGSVIINLSRLFRNPDFVEECKREAPNVDHFTSGTGRWWNQQQEVVLEVSEIRLDDIVALGGYSSSIEEFVHALYGQNPTKQDYVSFHLLLAQARQQLGADWIIEEAKDRVITKIRSAMPHLRAIKNLQEAMAHSNGN